MLESVYLIGLNPSVLQWTQFVCCSRSRSQQVKSDFIWI